nr:protein pellino isoform X1 [Leptinotarsa decemlineata]
MFYHLGYLTCGMRKMMLRSDGTESPILEEQESANSEKPKQQVKYGELVILGYNGFLPQGDRGRRRSKFVFCKRAVANGVKRLRHYVVKTPHSTHAILDANQHSISYTLSRNQAVIVEYTNDEDTDMFQIGRSSESPIDFVVMDTIPGDKMGETKVNQSTISRFACRILCDRVNTKIARIYAAGFDTSRNIFLGEKSLKWQENGREIDGCTTNGVLIMHPRGSFCGGEAKCGYWLETSVGGGIFSLRESRSAQQRGQVIEEVTNVLQDGTLIDLCGATLLWRSAEGLEKSPVSLIVSKC